MSLTTSKTVYKAGFGPLMPGVYVAPFPYAQQLPTGTEDPTQFCLDQVELLLKQQTDPSETAAMIIEPVLGEGGYVCWKEEEVVCVYGGGGGERERE
jgi:4-aminobutyrate aminotransferase